MFLVLIMVVFVTEMLYSFGDDNSKLRMSCSCIGMGLVTYYIGLVMILEGIANGNVIWFCNYNRNIIEFCFSFW